MKLLSPSNYITIYINEITCNEELKYFQFYLELLIITYIELLKITYLSTTFFY